MDIFYDEQLAASATTNTVQTLYNKYTSTPTEIDLSPTFQRDFVWSISQQAYLIDSILRGLPVPEIYVQESTAADGAQRTIVVDGQQRITSCIRYLGNEFPIPDADHFGNGWRGKYFSDLEDAEKKRFRGFSFVVRLLPEKITSDELRQIFKRLNQTVVALNRSELRNAEYTNAFTHLIKEIAQVKAFSDIGIFSGNDYRRKLDEEFIAEVILVIYSGAFPNKKQGLEEMFRDFDSKTDNDLQYLIDDLAKTIGRALSYLEPIANDLKRSRFRNKSDFYSLLVFMSSNAEHLSVNRRTDFKDRLITFSDRVTELRLKRTSEPSYGSVPIDGLAEKYLQAVQRAASDRLNRVERDEVLSDLLLPLLSPEPHPLDSSDDIRHWAPELDDENQPDLD